MNPAAPFPAFPGPPFPPGWQVERMDLDSKGRSSWLLSAGKGNFLGAVPDGGVPIRTFPPTADPVLFRHRTWEECLRTLPVPLRGRPECVSYRPLKRVTFRVLLEDVSGGRSRTAYLKVKRRPLPGWIREAVAGDGIWARLLFASLDEPAVELWEELGGIPLTRFEEGPPNRRADGLAATGRTLARLGGGSESVPPGAEPSRDERGWWERMEVALDRLSALHPEAAFPVRDAFARLTPPPRDPVRDSFVLLHGDLHDGQVFLGEDGEAKLLDPDTVCLGPPEWDVANLTAHLDLLAVRREGKPRRAEPARIRVLVDGYRSGLPGGVEFSAERFSRLREQSLLRLAAVYGARPPWRGLSALLADAVRKAPPVLAGLLLFSPSALLASPSPGADLDQLRDGLWVEVEGDHEAGHRLDADEIEVKKASTSRRAKLRGPIQAYDGETRVLTLLDVAVVVTARTEVKGPDGVSLTEEALGPGTAIQITGLSGSGLLPEAGTIEVLPAEEATKDSQVEGFVNRLYLEDGETKFTVNGVRIQAEPDVEVLVREDAAGDIVPPLDLTGSGRKRTDRDWQPPGIPIPGTDLAFGGRLNARVLSMDVEEPASGRFVQSGMHGRLYTRWDPSTWVKVFLEARFDHEQDIEDEPGLEQGTSRTSVVLGETYAAYRPSWFPPLALQAGRVDVEEEREWFFDENLDGIRVHLVTWDLVGHAGLYRRSLSPGPDDRDETYGIVHLDYRGWKAVHPNLFLIDRRDRRSDDHRTWFGGRIPLQAGGFRTWTDGAVARGDYRGNTFQTWAYDLGLLFRSKNPVRFSLYAGYARASGDPDRDDDIDREYRDPGLSDYNDSFDGVKSLYYLGEFTRPELSNLETWKIGAGIRPGRGWSIDVLRHDYRQSELRDRFRSVLDDLGIRPTGLDKDLGWELDVVLGVREGLPVEVELVWARFDPGAAFPDLQPSTHLHFEVEKRW